MIARELNINNLVLVDNEKYHPGLKDRIVRVVGIKLVEGIDAITFIKNTKYAISVKTTDNQLVDNDYNQYLKFIKPIQLTEEWLCEKTEFNKIGINFELGNFVIWYNTLTKMYVLRTGNNMCVEIKYIHKLQNLYFEIEGKELIIK